jgi:hypothetical protein
MHLQFNVPNEGKEFKPTFDTDWNVAFGFVGHEMTEDIGTWRVRHITRKFDRKEQKSVKINETTSELRPCRKDEFNLTDKNYE